MSGHNGDRSIPVQLGDHSVRVVPQRHARVRHLLKTTDLQALFSRDYGARTYHILSAFIDDLPGAMPEWEFDGYGSQEAAEAGEYDLSTDRSPRTDEIVDAFEAILNVSGADRLGKLLALAQDARRASEQQSNGQTRTPISPVSPGSTGA